MSSRLALIVAATAIVTITTAWLICGADVMAAEISDASKPRLSIRRVSVLTQAELRRIGEADKFEAATPKYSSQTRLWSVFLKQRGPLFAVDGEMLMVIEDVTGKVCMQQAMMPPAACT